MTRSSETYRQKVGREQGRTRRGKRDVVNELKTGRDTTVNVGRWTRYLAASEAKTGGVFGESLERSEHTDAAWAGFARETFAKLYGLSETEGEIAEADRPAGHEWVTKLHQHAESLPEWQALKQRAAGDPWACGVAAGEALNVAREAGIEAPDEDLDGLQAEADFVKELSEGGMTSPKHLRRLAQVNRRIEIARREHAAAATQVAEAESEIRTALRATIASVNEKMDEMDEALSGLGMGAGNGAGLASRVNAPRSEVRAALLRNKKLMNVVRLAGRLKVRAIAKQRSKARPGAEELCDITMGADVSRLVPSELANLADEATEALLYRRLMERSAVCYEMRGRETKAEGPIIMVVDESGSMGCVGANGCTRDEVAKAIALTMMELAARQNRPFAYVRFAERVVGVDMFPKPAQLPLAELEKFVMKFNGGGTAIGVGLREAGKLLVSAAQERTATNKDAAPWSKADVILVSDGQSYDNEAQASAVKTIKGAGAHLYGLFIGNDRSKATEKLCDEVVLVDDTTIEQVDGLFSI